MHHTLDSADQQRNLMKARALLTMATELLLDNAEWGVSTIESDLSEIDDFITDRIDDRLLAMNDELNPYYEYLHRQCQKGGHVFPQDVEANVSVALGLIRNTEFQKEQYE